jgi:hypothetical protein
MWKLQSLGCLFRAVCALLLAYGSDPFPVSDPGHPLTALAVRLSEEDIKNHIFSSYQADSLPYDKNHLLTAAPGTPKPPIDVDIGAAFKSLAEFDQMKSTFTLSVWLRHRWTDPRLAWEGLAVEGEDSEE